MAPNSEFGALFMGNIRNLQDIMNDVAHRLEQTAMETRPLKFEKIDEMQAFLYLDPLLSSLNKQYLDAKHNRIAAAKDFGADDGMTEMATLLEDSAWCAMQTRYMELRNDRELRAQANAMIEESVREEKRLRQKDKDKEALRAYEHMQMAERMRKPRGNNDEGLWLLVLMLSVNGGEWFRPYHATHNFNRLAA